MKYVKIQAICLVFYILIFPISIATATAAQNVAIVVPAHLRPYMEFVDGLKKSIKNPVTIFFLDKNISHIKKRVTSKHWDVVVGVGYKSISFLDNLNINGTNFIYSMIVYPEDIPENSRFKCGVYLVIPPEFILSTITTKFNKIKTILIPVSSKEAINYAKKIQYISKHFNINTLIVGTRHALPLLEKTNVVEQINKQWDKFDAILFVPDPIFSSKEVANFIIEQSILHKKAVIGYNKFFIENGATMCFLVDFKKTGIITGNLIKDILKNHICIPTYSAYNIEINQDALKYIMP